MTNFGKGWKRIDTPEETQLDKGVLRFVNEGKVTGVRVVGPMSQHAGEFEMPALLFRLCPRNQVKGDKKES